MLALAGVDHGRCQRRGVDGEVVLYLAAVGHVDAGAGRGGDGCRGDGELRQRDGRRIGRAGRGLPVTFARPHNQRDDQRDHAEESEDSEQERVGLAGGGFVVGFEFARDGLVVGDCHAPILRFPHPERQGPPSSGFGTLVPKCSTR